MSIYPNSIFEIYVVAFSICLLIIQIDGFEIDDAFVNFIDKVSTSNGLVLLVDFFYRVSISPKGQKLDGFLGTSEPTIIDCIVLIPYFLTVLRINPDRSWFRLGGILSLVTCILGVLFSIFQIQHIVSLMWCFLGFIYLIYILTIGGYVRRKFENDVDFLKYLLPSAFYLYLLSRLGYF